ncbi:hypothetical protein [Nocardia sp. NPDC057030]|uniref:hypothetical protein n=1 Tax=unclassified Nocardia TaxID=2637762 RepID=UPI00362A9882
MDATVEPATTLEVRQQNASGTNARQGDPRLSLLMILAVAAFGTGALSASRRTPLNKWPQPTAREAPSPHTGPLRPLGHRSSEKGRQQPGPKNNPLIHPDKTDPTPPKDPNPPKDLAPGNQEWTGDTRYREQGFESNSYTEWVPNHPGATTGTIRMGIGQQPADASWTTSGVDVWIDGKYQHVMPREVAPGAYLIEVPNVRIGQSVQFSGQITGTYRRGRTQYQAQTDINGTFTPRLTVRQRLDALYQRLGQTPPARTADEALAQLSSTLDGVEDDYSGVPRNPNPGLAWDGRMYPPRADNITRNPGGSIFARTKGSDINIGANGSIEIISRSTGAVEYFKPGGGA